MEATTSSVTDGAQSAAALCDAANWVLASAEQLELLRAGGNVILASGTRVYVRKGAGSSKHRQTLQAVRRCQLSGTVRLGLLGGGSVSVPLTTSAINGKGDSNSSTSGVVRLTSGAYDCTLSDATLDDDVLLQCNQLVSRCVILRGAAVIGSGVVACTEPCTAFGEGVNIRLVLDACTAL